VRGSVMGVVWHGSIKWCLYWTMEYSCGVYFLEGSSFLLMLISAIEPIYFLNRSQYRRE
jgi:hypothetical protein